MFEALRSSVNTWECDQMGHLNVRHYFGRGNDGIQSLLLELGLSARDLGESRAVVRASDQHVRFSRELRPGAAYALRIGVVAQDPMTLATYAELLNEAGERSATIVSTSTFLELATGQPKAWPADLRQAPAALRCKVPDYAAPRGVSAQPTRRRPVRSQIERRGLIPAFLGPIGAEHCDADGLMRESGCMALISDGIPHFFRALQGGSRPAGIGGAALEYRFAFHSWPRHGDVIEVWSGLIGLGNKTLSMIHYLFDRQSGECVAAAEAIAVWFDLTSRRALVVPDETRARLASKVLSGLQL
jgi:acyl-CoA thioester hydrolase